MQFKRLLKYAGKYKKYLLLCPLVMIGEVVMEMLLPLITARLIDEAIPACQATGSLRQVIVLGAAMLVMACVSMAFGMAGSRLAALGGMGFARNLRQAIFEKVQHFSFKNIDHFSTASLVTRLTTDMNQTQNVVMMLVRMAVRSPIQFILAFFMAARMNASLLPVLAVAVPLLLVGAGIIMSKAFPRFQIMMKKYDALNASVQENLIAIRVVKAFVRAAHEKEKFNASADDVTATQRAAEKIVLWNSPMMQILVYGCIVSVLWLGGQQVIGGTMEIGALSSFISYITQILMSLMMLSFLLVSFVMARASVARICEVLDEEQDIVSPAHAEEKVQDGSIVFDHVGFSYSGDQDNLVLSDVNFTIKSGETIGLIGGTGSAKTTLVGGKDVRSYDIHALRDQVSMVLQKNVLFSGSIKDNLRWGDEHATDAEITAACQASAADEFVRSFPGGYDMDLGQGGVNVSGGQKQRLCIARALLKKPKIIIFDDATSAVDTATDSRIREALRTAMPDTTKIIIAQRITSVMDADRIIVLNDGKVDDIGTHDELMARNEIYREVYSSQQKGVA